MGTIYQRQTSSRAAFVKKTLDIFKDQLGGARKIFIKPNIVSSEPYPTTTHPEVLDALLSALSDRDVIVGDAPALDAGRSDKVMSSSPLKPICEKRSTSLVNLYSKPMKRFRSPRGYSIKVSAVPSSCDFAISIPVLKTHNICGMSSALKNQFGYLSKTDRILMHTKLKDIHKGIAEINVAIRTDLFIVDAVETMIKAQETRHGGHAAQIGLMMAGTDPVSLDSYGLGLLRNLEPQLPKVKYFDYAVEYGVGVKEYKVKNI